MFPSCCLFVRARRPAAECACQEVKQPRKESRCLSRPLCFPVFSCSCLTSTQLLLLLLLLLLALSLHVPATLSVPGSFARCTHRRACTCLRDALGGERERDPAGFETGRGGNSTGSHGAGTARRHKCRRGDSSAPMGPWKRVEGEKMGGQGVITRRGPERWADEREKENEIESGEGSREI